MKKNAEDTARKSAFLSEINEGRFFDLVRLYVGEIKTPYNKQKLIESLSAFFHKEENRLVLYALLSETDLIFIAAVIHIPRCTEEKAADFFGSQFSFSFLHDTFLNLEERLIVYRRSDGDEAEFFEINPLLREELEKRAPAALLFPVDENAEAVQQTLQNGSVKSADVKGGGTEFFVSNRLLASWFAFAAEFPDYCRLDGSLKKKAALSIKERFADIPQDFLTALDSALRNLSLFRRNGARCEADRQKLQSFARLPPLSRCAYLAAAFCGAFRRDVLCKNAALTAELLHLLPVKEERRPVSQLYILRAIFLLRENQKCAAEHTESRLRRLLAEHAQFDDNAQKAGFKSENLFEALVRFGIVVPCFEDGAASESAAEQLYFINSDLFADCPEKDMQNAISIDAGFSLTVLKELSLDVFLDLTSCTDLEICATVSRFRITRTACLRAFENGMPLEKIIGLLQKTASHKLPQNLLFSLRDWYNLYSSGNLFKGYVLQVAEDKRVQTENNPALAPYIRVCLAPGIYILNFSSDEEAADIIKKSGLEFIGAVKNSEPECAALPFSDLDAAPECAQFLRHKDFAEQIREKTAAAEFEKRHMVAMEAELKKKNLPKEQEDELLLRIRRKTVLSHSQLRENSARVEKNEASGMDFLGKIRVIENAIACCDPVEVVCAGESLCGIPLVLEKQSGDAALMLRIENCAEPKKISVAQARFVKRIRSSVFGSSR